MTTPSLRHPGVNPFTGWDMQTLLEKQANARGTHLCLIWEPFEGPQRRWTYAEFADETARLAAGMAAKGVSKGDFILIHMENCPEFLLAWFACARIGAVAVTTNTRSAGEELAYYSEDAGIAYAITQPKFADLVAANCPNLRWIAVTAMNAAGDAAPRPEQAQEFDTLYGRADGLPARAADSMAPLCVMYTSGTTSRPKGVVWTHANGLWAGRGGAFSEGLTPDDTHLVMLPLFHMNAMSCQVLASLWVGATIVLQPRFSSSRFWDVSLRNKCTVSSVVPFCTSALAAQPVPDHHYRLWGAGINCIYDKDFRVRSLGWWGMTETVTVGIVGSVYHEDSPRTLGRPSPLYEIAVVGDDGKGVAPGAVGDLLIKGIPGVSIFERYLNNPEATEASFDEHGFFMTGDRVKLNEDGTLSFQDRSKDMLKVGGENVSASEVERVIMEIPGVAEVAVVAAPHKMLNEVPVAFVILKPGAAPATVREQIAEKCERTLADFKRPRDIRIVEALPRANLEKVAKARLRAQLASEVHR